MTTCRTTPQSSDWQREPVGILTHGTSVPSLMADLTAREHLKLKLQVRQKVTMSAQHW